MTKFNDDGVTIIAIITLTIGAFAMVTKLCYKSKCSNINFVTIANAPIVNVIIAIIVTPSSLNLVIYIYNI